MVGQHSLVWQQNGSTSGLPVQHPPTPPDEIGGEGGEGGEGGGGGGEGGEGGEGGSELWVGGGARSAKGVLLASKTPTSSM